MGDSTQITLCEPRPLTAKSRAKLSGSECTRRELDSLFDGKRHRRTREAGETDVAYKAFCREHKLPFYERVGRRFVKVKP